MTDTPPGTPDVLLAHHLKALKLPTFCASMTSWLDSARATPSITSAICCGWPNWS